MDTIVSAALKVATDPLETDAKYWVDRGRPMCPCCGHRMSLGIYSRSLFWRCLRWGCLGCDPVEGAMLGVNVW